MMDFLFESGDMKVTQGDIELCKSDNQAIAQAISIRLKTLQGEWFMDTQVGIPYLTEIFGRKLSEQYLRHIFTKQIGSIADVEEITDFRLEESERSIGLNMVIRLKDRREIKINETMEI